MGALCCSGEKGTETEPSAGRAEGLKHYDHQVLAAESSYLTYFGGLRTTGPLPAGVSGLANLGNTCFINSALQCLAAVPSLTDYFLSGSYKRDLTNRRSGILASLFAALLLQRCKEGVRLSHPTDLVTHVWRYSHFSPRSQNDSQEFLAYFLDQLHEDLNKSSGKSAVSSRQEVAGDEETMADLAWQSHLLSNRSIIVEKFQGVLKSSLSCMKCKHTSVTFEPFMFLSVPISSGRSDTLKECLGEFTKSERLGGSEKWTCPKCAVPVEALKKLDLWRIPPVLIIHLKRFYCQYESMGKLTKAISYPISNLSLDQFIGRQSRLPSYNLIAKINHMGSIASGHYTAHILVNGIWLECDDDRCSIVPSSALQSSDTYVLMYAASKDHDLRTSDTSVSSATTLPD